MEIKGQENKPTLFDQLYKQLQARHLKKLADSLIVTRSSDLEQTELP
jgi:hypothetical protein